MKPMKFKQLAVMGGLLAGLFSMSAMQASAAALPAPEEVFCTGAQPTACVPLNGGGSSAATPFMTQVPLNLLDQPVSPSTNFPVHYVNGDILVPSITAGKLHVWTGNRGGVPTIIRYSATGSSDGVLRLQNPTTNASSLMHYLDHLAGTCSSGPTLKTRAADSKQYYEYTGCNTVVAGDLPETMGMADVAGSSFHQVGPFPTAVKPLDQSMLTSTSTAIVPWQFIVGEHVKKDIGIPPAHNLVPVVGFSRLEIEAILGHTVTDWRQLGLVTDVGTLGTPDASSPITLCLRSAGSGSKAALDETVMKDANEFTVQTVAITSAADGVIFGTSTQDVQDCIRGNAGNGRPAHPRGIAYVDADVSVATLPAYPVKLNGMYASDIVVFGQSTSNGLPPQPAPNNTLTTLDDTSTTNSSNDGATNIVRNKFTPGALVGDLVVIIGGTGAGQSFTITGNTATQLSVAPANWATVPDATSAYKVVPDLSDSKQTVRCGQYYYWAGERMNVRNYADPGITADMTSLNNDFITSSSSAPTVALLPAGQFWVAGSDMYTFKNADAGPVFWKAGAHPCAQ